MVVDWWLVVTRWLVVIGTSGPSYTSFRLESASRLNPSLRQGSEMVEGSSKGGGITEDSAILITCLFKPSRACSAPKPGMMTCSGWRVQGLREEGLRVENVEYVVETMKLAICGYYLDRSVCTGDRTVLQC